MTAANDGAIWERCPGESPRQYHAFTHYRDHGIPGRSIDRAWRDHHVRCDGRQPSVRRAARRWQDWAAGWGWPERAQAWDAAQDRIARDRIAKDQLDARIRHARMASAALQALTVPSRATLEVLRDPTVMQRLVADARESTRGLLKLIDLVTWAGKTIPGLVAVERLSLGMSTELLEVEDRRADTLGQRIAADAQATDLAIALLDRLAGTGTND